MLRIDRHLNKTKRSAIYRKEYVSHYPPYQAISAQNNLLSKPEKPDPISKPIIPPDPIIQEPRETDFEAIRKLNKKAGKAVPSVYQPGSLASLQNVGSAFVQATQMLMNRPQNPIMNTSYGAGNVGTNVGGVGTASTGNVPPPNVGTAQVGSTGL